MDVERKKNVVAYVRVARARAVGGDATAQRRAIERYCRENNLVVAAALQASATAQGGAVTVASAIRAAAVARMWTL